MPALTLGLLQRPPTIALSWAFHQTDARGNAARLFRKDEGDYEKVDFDS
jgi:hypothetical protein